MAINPYRAAFTTGGLFLQEANFIVQTYFEVNDWGTVREIVIQHNLLKTRTRASSIRTSREIIQRLETLTRTQLQILSNGDRQEQNQILWLAVCKQYRLIQEFAMEVIREKTYRLDTSLSYADFDAFFNTKAEWHVELANLTLRTRSELRRVLFQMLRQAEILSSANQILPALPAPRVARAILADDPAWSMVFPVSDTDVNRQAAL